MPALTVVLAPLTDGYLTLGDLADDKSYPGGLTSLLRNCWYHWLNLWRSATPIAVLMAARWCFGEAELANDEVSSDGEVTSSFPVLM